jgi:uncharacterized protein YukE
MSSTISVDIDLLTQAVNDLTALDSALDAQQNHVQHLSHEVNCAIQGSVAHNFEEKFACWLQNLNTMIAEVDEAKTALCKVLNDANSAASALNI